MENIDTTKNHVFITGASGCVGHYLIRECLNIQHLHIHVLVRYPEKLKFSKDELQHITIHQGDFKDIEMFEPVIKKMNYIIHSLTSWWGPNQTDLINVKKTKDFFLMADTNICKQIIYFSTASILGENNKVVEEAEKYGSDYIRTKYLAYHMIKTLPHADRITTLFPTMVFGGDAIFPQSHITKGISKARQYLKFLRFIYVDGAFHFMHAADIAKVTIHLMQFPNDKREYALGNSKIHIKETLQTLSTAFKMEPWFQVHINHKFILFLAKILRITIGPWERYCIANPYMVFDVVNPTTFGLNRNFETLSEIIDDIQSFTPA